jgi:Pyruvate/2-oxoacid:ferredoxin oxidoreductase delta subunit
MLSQHLKIYYFSGTGNSFNVAKWMAGAASIHNIESSVCNIATIDRSKVSPESSDTILVFVSPVHGFNYPPIMLKFIARFPKAKNKVILMDTRGGLMFGNISTPGVSGAAFLFSTILLKIKGYSVVGLKSVDLPSNWMSLHPTLSQKAIKKLHEKQKVKVLCFAEKVLSGKNTYISLLEYAVDVLVAPVAIAYYFAGRFFFAKTFYASGNCDNCDVCIKNCPVNAIIKVDNRPFWTYRCESCMQCMSKCPKKCIETAHGFIIAFFIFASALSGLFFYHFNHWFFYIPEGIFRYVIETVLFLTLLAVLYRIIHYLMRIIFIERIMVYTSFTKYRFWGKRYKALKNI